MRKNDNYLIDMILRIKGSNIFMEGDTVVVEISQDLSYTGGSISECLDLIREDFTHELIWKKIRDQDLNITPSLNPTS